MAIIARLAGEGIGPFKSFDFDFSDAEGKPHPGPHIFAGINGSGKSTVLRTLAWMLEQSLSSAFQWIEWSHLIQGYEVTRAMMILSLTGAKPFVVARTMDTNEGWEERLHTWVLGLLADGKIESLKDDAPIHGQSVWPSHDNLDSHIDEERREVRGSLRIGGRSKLHWRDHALVAGYGPARLLKYLPQVNLSVQLKHFRANALSFEATVQNEVIQSWLLGLFSKMAIAKQRGENLSKYSTALERFENTLGLMCDQEVRFSVDIEPSLQPRLVMYGKRLDFSQLPDGVRSTAGWLADFLMRMDMHPLFPEAERGYALLLDEVDAHLHPKWQRSILPSIKKTLPEVQVFATSHSPFVIASCLGARIHVLELDKDGVAHNRPAEDAPVGESILATIKDIFGVSSRFDIETERLLEEWNELHRVQSNGHVSGRQQARIAELTRDLSSRSEELRQIVSPMVSINESLAASLKSQAGQPDKKRKGKRG